jgi:cytoskeleton protein RodZ
MIGTEGRPPTVGEILRRARLERRISLSEVESELHVRLRYLQALETDDYSVLPPSVYTRALVREYAKFLGLDPSQVLDRSVPMRPEDRNPIRPAIGPLDKPPIVSWKAISTVAVVAMCAGLFMYLYYQYSSFATSIGEIDQTPPLATAPSAAGRPIPTVIAAFPTFTPTSAPQPTAPPTPIAGLVLEARLVDRSWVQVWVDDRSVVAENMPAGTTRSFTADRSIRMRVGNAGGVDVTVNGQNQGRLGTAGQQLEATWGRD